MLKMDTIDNIGIFQIMCLYISIEKNGSLLKYAISLGYCKFPEMVYSDQSLKKCKHVACFNISFFFCFFLQQKL